MHTIKSWHATLRLDMHIYWFHVYLLSWNFCYRWSLVFKWIIMLFYFFFFSIYTQSIPCNGVVVFPLFIIQKWKFLTRLAAIWLWCNCLDIRKHTHTHTHNTSKHTIYWFSLESQSKCEECHVSVNTFHSGSGENKRTYMKSCNFIYTKNLKGLEIFFLLFLFRFEVDKGLK